MTLGHEIGAGAACLKCKDKCEGFELHFWRFVLLSTLLTQHGQHRRKVTKKKKKLFSVHKQKNKKIYPVHMQKHFFSYFSIY